MISKKALLLSGGLDSTAVAYWLKNEIALAITVDYGQKSSDAEILSSSKVCDELKIDHCVIRINCKELGSGEMTQSGKTLNVSPSPEWWPFRNQLLITFASMKIIQLNITELLLGTVKTDSKHADGTSLFFDKMDQLTSVQEGNVHVYAPAINLTTVELVKTSNIPASILYWAHSCHTSSTPCGICNGCKKYLETTTTLQHYFNKRP